MHSCRPPSFWIADSDSGSPFTNPTGDLPSANAHNVNILDHASNVLFSAQLSDANWSNFAVAVDWDNCTLAVYFSPGANPLELVSPTMSNPGVEAGPDGQGEFHFGLLKVSHFLLRDCLD